jgi:hypothetical protein
VKRLLSFLIYLITLQIIGLIVAPKFINWEPAKNRIITQIRSATNRELIVNGKISFTFLPFPELRLKDVELSDDKTTDNDNNSYFLKARSLKLNFDILELFNGNLKGYRLTISNADINLIAEKKDNNLLKQTIENINREMGLNKFTIRSSNLNIIYSNRTALQARKANLDLDYIPNQSIKLTGNLLSGNIPVNILADFNYINPMLKNGKVKLSSNTMNISFDGQLENNDHFRGNLSGDIGNLSKFTNSLNSNFLTFENITSNEAVKINSTFSFSSKEAIIDNLTFKSPNINITGKINSKFEEILSMGIEFLLTDINLDSLTQGKTNVKKTTEEETIDLFKNSDKDNYFKLNLPDNTEVLFDLKIKNITYQNKQLEHLNINAQISNNILNINQFAALLPFNTNINIEGSLTDNGIRPEFQGKILGKGGNTVELLKWFNLDYKLPSFGSNPGFNIDSELFITPKYLSLNNLKATIANILLNGELALRYRGSSSVIEAYLDINSLNFDEHQVGENIYTRLKEFTEASNLNLTHEFQALRRFKSSWVVDINFNDFVWEKKSYRTASCSLDITPGSIKCKKLRITSDSEDLTGLVYFDIRAIRPKIDIQLSGLNLDISKKDNEAESTEQIDLNKSFNFHNFDKIDGTYWLGFKALKINDFIFNNLMITGELLESIFTVSDMRSELFDGTMNVTGSVGLNSSKSLINMNLALSGVNMNDLLSKAYSMNNVEGILSLSGSINSFGTSFREWINNSEAVFSLAGRNAIIKDFDLNQIINIAGTNKRITNEQFKETINSSMNSGVTFINNIDGKFDITRGILQTSSLTFGNERMNGVAAASINLSSSLANIATKFAFIPIGSHTALNFDVKLSGTLDKPTKEPVTDEITNFLKQKGMLE